jgi:hypothetical protein
VPIGHAIGRSEGYRESKLPRGFHNVLPTFIMKRGERLWVRDGLTPLSELILISAPAE